MIQQATDATFTDKVMTADRLTLVDFYAPWCGPCRMLAPIIEDIATEYGERLNVVKVDVDESPATAQQFGVMSIPTLYFVSAGRPVGRLVGFQSRASLSEAIDQLLQD